MPNPEGINQYTHGGGGAAKASANADKFSRVIKQTGNDHQAAHSQAAALHRVAAAESRAEGNHSAANYHEAMANAHGQASLAASGPGKEVAARALRAAGASRLSMSLSAASAALNGRTPAEQSRHEDAKRASSAAHGATRAMAVSGSTSVTDHDKAAYLHDKAAAANRVAGNHEEANYHTANADAHRAGAHASKYDTGNLHRAAAQALEHAEQSRLSSYHGSHAEAAYRRGR